MIEDTMVYVHTNLHIIYRKKKEWVKGKTKMWDLFSDDMGLDNSTKLELANLDLNDPMLEFDDTNHLVGSSSTPADIDPIMVEEESSDEFVDSSMEEDEDY